MTSERSERAHPSGPELAAWVDEPGSRVAAVREHLEGCGPCRERVAGIEITRAALALDPPMPSEAAFAAQRERILAAIGAAPPAQGTRIAGRAAWMVPLAAAAAIAVFVLVGRPGGDPNSEPTAPGASAEAGAALPVVADAAAAAEEAAGSIAPAEDPSPVLPAVPAEAIDEELLDAALAAAEPLAPPVSVERSLTTEFLFAELPEDEQSAVLVEMASADLEF